MEFKIGQLDVTTAPAYGTAAFSFVRLRRPDLLAMGPTEFYFWDCRKRPNGNPQRPGAITLKATLFAKVLTPLGQIHTGQSAAREARLQNASGLSDMDAVIADIRQTFPPITINIPWKDLNSLFQDSFSWRYLVWIAYAHMIVQPKTGPTQDSYVLSIPIGARFEAIPVWYCPLNGGFLVSPTQKSKTIGLPQPAGKPTELKREHDEERARFRREQPQKDRQISDSFKRDSDKRREQIHTRLRKQLDELLDELEDF